MAKASEKHQTRHVEEQVIIEPVETGILKLWLVGTSPLICNRVSEKAKRELLLPRGKKTAAEKATTLKHDPLTEFRASPYIDPLPNGPTLLQHLASAVKAAMRGAAVDLPGARKAQIGRLCWVTGEKVPLYGVPQIFMSVVRNAGIVRTPDIRTRVIVPHWAMPIVVTFVSPIIRQQSVYNLLAAAGLTQGTGDWRPEKGAGTHGQWRLANDDDSELLQIMKTGGRKAQAAAMESPEPYDRETAEQLAWYTDEVDSRMTKREQARAKGNSETRA